MKIAFIGHRKINLTTALTNKLNDSIKLQLERCPSSVFLFGSKSNFDALCLKIVSNFKREFPNLKRVYVRAEYKNIDNDYLKYIYTQYDHTFFPDEVVNAGTLSYIIRNKVMIDLCDCLYTYYNPDYKVEYNGKKTQSGTYIAISYAIKKNKQIKNFYNA